MVPVGTTGTPTDIGHAVAWLCSDYARLITGIDLVVDGGAWAKNCAYAPAAPEDLAGPLPLIVLDETPGLSLSRRAPEAGRRGRAAGLRSPS
jgi:hypothetical protein